MNELFENYKKAIANVPILKYSRIIVATIFILSLIAYFKLQNSIVFAYAFAVIFLSFIGFLFSLFLNNKDKIIKTLRYILVTCIVITTAIAVLGFGTFIIWQKPVFYKRWFPDRVDKLINTTKIDTTTKENNIHSDTLEKEKNKSKTETIKVSKPSQNETESKSIIISIQLSQENKGYSEIFLNGKKVIPMLGSTKFNPRISVKSNNSDGELLIITNNGDSCYIKLPHNSNETFYRIIPNCK